MAVATLSEREQSLNELKDEILVALEDLALEATVVRGELTLTVPAASIVRVLTYLRDETNCLFKMLVDVCGVDNWVIAPVLWTPTYTAHLLQRCWDCKAKNPKYRSFMAVIKLFRWKLMACQ
jgi:NADH:ubiquinone oxidoreductase subunit C